MKITKIKLKNRFEKYQNFEKSLKKFLNMRVILGHYYSPQLLPKSM